MKIKFTITGEADVKDYLAPTIEAGVIRAGPDKTELSLTPVFTHYDNLPPDIMASVSSYTTKFESDIPKTAVELSSLKAGKIFDLFQDAPYPVDHGEVVVYVLRFNDSSVTPISVEHREPSGTGYFSIIDLEVIRSKYARFLDKIDNFHNTGFKVSTIMFVATRENTGSYLAYLNPSGRLFVTRHISEIPKDYTVFDNLIVEIDKIPARG